MPSFPSVEPPNPPKRTSSPRPLSKIFRTLKLSRPRPRSSSPSPTRCRRSTDDDEARSRQSSESRPLSWLGGSWHRHHNGRTRAASPERTEPSVKTPAQPSEYADATRHPFILPPPPARLAFDPEPSDLQESPASASSDDDRSPRSDLLPKHWASPGSIATAATSLEPSSPSGSGHPTRPRSPISLSDNPLPRSICLPRTAFPSEAIGPPSSPVRGISEIDEAEDDTASDSSFPPLSAFSYADSVLAALDLAASAKAFEAAQRAAEAGLPLEFRLRIPFSFTRERSRKRSGLSGLPPREGDLPVAPFATVACRPTPGPDRARVVSAPTSASRASEIASLRSFAFPPSTGPAFSPRSDSQSTFYEAEGGVYGTYARRKPRLRSFLADEAQEVVRAGDAARQRRASHRGSRDSAASEEASDAPASPTDTLDRFRRSQAERQGWDDASLGVSSARVRTMSLLERQRRRSMLSFLQAAERAKWEGVLDELRQRSGRQHTVSRPQQTIRSLTHPPSAHRRVLSDPPAMAKGSFTSFGSAAASTRALALVSVYGKMTPRSKSGIGSRPGIRRRCKSAPSVWWNADRPIAGRPSQEDRSSSPVKGQDFAAQPTSPAPSSEDELVPALKRDKGKSRARADTDSLSLESTVRFEDGTAPVKEPPPPQPISSLDAATPVTTPVDASKSDVEDGKVGGGTKPSPPSLLAEEPMQFDDADVAIDQEDEVQDEAKKEVVVGLPQPGILEKWGEAAKAAAQTAAQSATELASTVAESCLAPSVSSPVSDQSAAEAEKGVETTNGRPTAPAPQSLPPPTPSAPRIVPVPSSGPRRPISPLGKSHGVPRRSSPLATAPPISARSLSMTPVESPPASDPPRPPPLSIPEPESLKPPPPPKKRKRVRRTSTSSSEPSRRYRKDDAVEDGEEGTDPTSPTLAPVKPLVKEWLEKTDGKMDDLELGEVASPPLVTETEEPSPKEPSPQEQRASNENSSAGDEEHNGIARATSSSPPPEPAAEVATGTKPVQDEEEGTITDAGIEAKNEKVELSTTVELEEDVAVELVPTIATPFAVPAAAPNDEMPVSQIWLLWISMTSLIIAMTLLTALETVRLTLQATSSATSADESFVRLNGLPPRGRVLITASDPLQDRLRRSGPSSASWLGVRSFLDEWLRWPWGFPRPSHTWSANLPRAAVPPLAHVSVGIPVVTYRRGASSIHVREEGPVALEVAWSTGPVRTEWEEMVKRGRDAAALLVLVGLVCGVSSLGFSARRRVLGRFGRQ